MTLKIALLGTGLAARLHSRTLKAVAPDVERWYASRDRTRADAAAAKFGGAGAVSPYERALERPDITAVLIGLPPALHLEWVLRALEAGKHVILEKPPFMDSADVDRVADAALRADRQVLVAENYFYKPLAGLLRRVIARGDLGDVRFLQLNALKGQKTGDWRDQPDLAGHGALYEGGIHWISLLTSLGLTVTRARAARPGPREGLDRNMLVTLEYAEGAVATLAYSWDLPGLVNGIRWSACYGTAGALRFETNGLVAVQAGRRRRIMIPGVVDLLGYRAMMADFLAAIRQNRPPAYSLDLARRDLALVEQAYASLA